MRKLALLIILFYCANSFALSFGELQGCYKTLDVDGYKPAHGPLASNNQTLFEDLGNRTYRSTEDNRPLDIYVLTVFQGYTEPYYGYNSFVIFPDLGEIIEQDDKLVYRVDEDVYMKSSGHYSKVDHKLELEIRRVSQTRFIASAYYQSNHRSARRKTNFTIQTQECLD